LTIDDQELDRLLRKVPVPRGLADRLKRIPLESPVVTPAPSRPALSRRGAIAVAVAASLLGLVCWFLWPHAVREQPVVALPGNAAPPPGSPLVPNARQLENLGRNLDSLSGEIGAFRARLGKQQQLVRRSRIQPAATASALSRSEQDALTLYLANETAGQWAGPSDFVRAEMQRIIEQFPGTTGARRAREFLGRTSKL
jgi:hypothetical protein